MNVDHELTRLQRHIDEHAEQMRHFLLRRPVGEELSLLFFGAKQLQLGNFQYQRRAVAGVLRAIERRMTPEDFGRNLKRVLSKISGLKLSGIDFCIGWGRALDRVERGLPMNASVPEPVEDYLYAFDFVKRAYSTYRDDGNVYPSAQPQKNPFGPLRILDRDTVLSIEDAIVPIENPAAVATLQELLARLKGYAFLLERDSREGLFMHGPYPGEDGRQLVIIEFQDLWGDFYLSRPNLPWRALGARLPYSNLAFALQLTGEVTCQFDAFGVMHPVPDNYSQHIVGACVFTREGDEWLQGPLVSLGLDLQRIGDLREKVDTAHAELFMQISQWDGASRLMAGAYGYVKQMKALLNYAQVSPEVEQELLYRPWEEAREKYFEQILRMQQSPLPVYAAVQARMQSGQPLFPPAVCVPSAPASVAPVAVADSEPVGQKAAAGSAESPAAPTQAESVGRPSQWRHFGQGRSCAGAQSVEGTLRVVRQIGDVVGLMKKPPTDLIALTNVAGGTTIAPLLRYAKGVICTIGSTGSHLAIVARDFNIPCVIGALGVPFDESLNNRRVRIESSGEILIWE